MPTASFQDQPISSGQILAERHSETRQVTPFFRNQKLRMPIADFDCPKMDALKVRSQRARGVAFWFSRTLRSITIWKRESVLHLQHRASKLRELFFPLL